MDFFNIHESIKAYIDNPASIIAELSSLPESDYMVATNDLVDSVAVHPDAIFYENLFNTLQNLLFAYPRLSKGSRAKVADLLTSSIRYHASVTQTIIKEDRTEFFDQQRRRLEYFGFLVQWLIDNLETMVQGKNGLAPGGSLTSRKPSDLFIETTAIVLDALSAYSILLKLDLSRLFDTDTDRDVFISLIARPVYHIMENEQRIKNKDVKFSVFRVLCAAIKEHGHSNGAETTLIQHLNYYEHLSEYIAELLHLLDTQYKTQQLAEKILSSISSRQFSATDTKTPKSFAAFISKLAELSPGLVQKSLSTLKKQLDSDSYAVRCSIISACGSIIISLCKENEETFEMHKSQIYSLLDLIEERLLDIHTTCRSRSLSVLTSICDLPFKLNQRRQGFTEHAIQSLSDRSSFVRKNAIKLLSKLISSHPFTLLHGSQLNIIEWKSRLETVKKELSDAISNENGAIGLAGRDQMREDENTPENTQNIDTEAINRLKLAKQYYIDAIKFINTVEKGIAIAESLLFSRTKSEVPDMMDIFVLADAFDIVACKSGIRKMLHLVWTKTTNDEGKGIQSHLLRCYKSLFFDAPSGANEHDAAILIARNLISLTYGTTLPELTSMERLLCLAYEAKLIPDLVVKKLWAIYAINKDIYKHQRRGAIIILGMLALADNEVASSGIDLVIKIGLGDLGRNDLSLAKYSCIVLERVSVEYMNKKKDTTPAAIDIVDDRIIKLPNSHEVIVQLANMLTMYTDDTEWFSVAAQAINAIYSLSESPDTVCGEIIRQKTESIFNKKKAEQDQAMDDNDINNESEDFANHAERNDILISQLLIIVGHVAIKAIVHLERIESEFKRLKVVKEKQTQQKAKKNKSKRSRNRPVQQDEPDDFDLINGTTEDDFTEAISYVRERELLYGPTSLLSRFGPLVVHICESNTTYQNPTLQIAATLCLTKMMCVSSIFCERNLPLLLTILERSESAIIRSNIVLSLGDLAVCFNHLLDENTEFLYRRLQDPNHMVQRTCLMTLTFLILAGQVKVKGQLGEMAKCTEDEDKGIRDLAKMFFIELATKDNAIYNGFIDIFSSLSNDQFIEDEAKRRILKFLLNFIDKDKHVKSLAEKLFLRLNACENERQWRDIAFVLGLLAHKNEDIDKAISEGFRFVSGRKKTTRKSMAGDDSIDESNDIENIKDEATVEEDNDAEDEGYDNLDDDIEMLDMGDGDGVDVENEDAKNQSSDDDDRDGNVDDDDDDEEADIYKIKGEDDD